MKYKAVIETDDYKGFEFFEDGIGKYMVGRDAGATDFGGGGWIPLYFTECEEESETITEFADRCRECGAKYGKILKQETKIGHWIMLGGKEEIYCEEAKCSICGSVEVNAGYDKYCPNCGAKMIKSPQESEDKEG